MHLPLHAIVEQAGFRKELVREVAAFVLDARAFRSDWELQGPMVPGLDPMEAVDRLKKFQQLFEVRTLRHLLTAVALRVIITALKACVHWMTSQVQCDCMRRCANANGTAMPAARSSLGSLSHNMRACSRLRRSWRCSTACTRALCWTSTFALSSPALMCLWHLSSSNPCSYRLYVNVITTIRGFGDLLWVDVVAQIDSMTEQVVAFQAQYSKLPKV